MLRVLNPEEREEAAKEYQSNPALQDKTMFSEYMALRQYQFLMKGFVELIDKEYEDWEKRCCDPEQAKEALSFLKQSLKQLVEVNGEKTEKLISDTA